MTPEPQHPPTRRLGRAERQEAITAHVVSRGAATPNELASLTGASLMTVHRDLDELARQGVLRKFHGGVSAQPSSVFEASAAYRANVQVAEKEALGRAAVQKVEPGMSILLDTSTTNLHVLEALLALPDRPFTVITNYLPVMQRLRDERDIRLIGLGGAFNRTHQAYLGPTSDAMVRGISADVAFLSTSAMTVDTAYHQEEAVISSKQAMMEVSEHTVLLMNPTKIRRRALHRLCAVEEFGKVLLTEAGDAEFLTQLAERVPTEVVPLDG